MSDFSFVIVTDTHVDVREDRSDGLWWNKMLVTPSPEIFAAGVQEINAREPDFVVHCGDLTNRSDQASQEEAARLSGKLDMPFHFVPGNHDTYDPGSRERAARLFGLDGQPFYRVRRKKDWRLIFLDTVYWLHKDGSVREDFSRDDYVDIAVPEEEMAWLRAELDRDNSTPTLCFTHTVMATRPSYPVSRMPGGKEVDTFPVKLDAFLTCADVADLLKNQHCVKGVFYGHGHWHDCLVEDGTLFCQTAALVEYPCEARLVRVFADRLETEVFGLSGRDYARLSFVEEGDNRWVAGRDQDRCMTHSF